MNKNWMKSLSVIFLINFLFLSHTASSATKEEKIGWNPKDNTPGVELKVKEVSRVKKRGYTEIEIEIVGTGFPLDKYYTLWVKITGVRNVSTILRHLPSAFREQPFR